MQTDYGGMAYALKWFSLKGSIMVPKWIRYGRFKVRRRRKVRVRETAMSYQRQNAVNEYLSTAQLLTLGARALAKSLDIFYDQGK